MKEKSFITDPNLTKIIKKQGDEIAQIKGLIVPNELIKSSEEIIKKFGYDVKDLSKSPSPKQLTPKKISWESLCEKVKDSPDVEIESLFTPEELVRNREEIKLLEDKFLSPYKLDKLDLTISVIAGLLGASIDVLMIGIPHPTKDGLASGLLPDYIRSFFDKTFPKDVIEELENSPLSKVPYDAQDNRNTTIDVYGLSTYYHRLLSLGHDPVLGFIVGIFDIMTGRMTTIDKLGKIVSQKMDCYSGRVEDNLFYAFAKQITHFASDIATPMGLPVPCMGLFNLLQFGSIGEEEQTIAEIVQGMYYQGYDFRHFCSLSIPTMLIDVLTRLSYSIKAIKNDTPIKDAIPFSTDNEKHPKLATMLLIAHSTAAAINTGKIIFTQNPLAINYPEWLLFSRYVFKQLRWTLFNKKRKQLDFIERTIDSEYKNLFAKIDAITI